MGHDHVAHAFAHEGWPAGDHLEHDATERVDVRAVVDRVQPTGLLGRHVKGRSKHAAGLGVPHGGVQELRDPEVEDLDDRAPLVLRERQEDVVGFKVAVNDALVVGGL